MGNVSPISSTKAATLPPGLPDRSSSPSGASGAWVRKFSGRADVRWWGAVADDPYPSNGGTDNLPAITAALATLAARSISDHPARRFSG